MAGRPRVSILFPNQDAEAAAMLGRAFVDDPLIKAIVPPLPDAVERARCMGALFAAALAGQRSEGQPVIGVIHDQHVGAAAIIEQAMQRPSKASLVFHGIARIPSLLRAVGAGGLKRALATVDLLSRNRPAAPHIYLNVLGVEPALQGQHFGGALLDCLREQCSLRPEIAGVYLETAKEANVAYYSSAGYRVIGEIFPLGVRTWQMLQPRAA